MTKAEEKSEQYKDFREQCGIKDPVMLNEIEEAYFEGYLQAEKDLELTWEDMAHIIDIGINLAYRLPCPPKDPQPFFEEVLKRFKEYKTNKQ